MREYTRNVYKVWNAKAVFYCYISCCVLSKNCVNLSMYYVIIFKTRVVLSIYSVDTLSYYVKEPFCFVTTWSYLV